jgi:GT2 family glycosyltransferase
LIRRVVFEQTGGFSQAFAPAEDLDLWLRVSLINPVIGVPVPILRYRIHEETFSSAPVAMARRSLELFRRHAGEHLRWGYPASLGNAATSLYRWYAPRLRMAGRAALQQSQWPRVLESVCTEGRLLALLITTKVRLKGMLLANGRWRLPPGALEREAVQRGQMISKTPDAP